VDHGVYAEVGGLPGIHTSYTVSTAPTRRRGWGVVPSTTGLVRSTAGPRLSHSRVHEPPGGVTPRS
jgi:hypothetical protein